MDIAAFKSDWAAWLALVPAMLAAFIVCRTLLRRSSRGQLVQARNAHRDAQKALENAGNDVRNASAKFEDMSRRVDKVKPRLLEEAKEALEDSRALEKILDDKCQVTMNHLRRVIFEEFPPSRHAKMRLKYLPQDVEDGRPFSF